VANERTAARCHYQQAAVCQSYRQLAHLRFASVNDGSGPGVIGPEFATFSAAYVAVLSQVVRSPQYETATRGSTAREILNGVFPLLWTPN